jgi:nucleotide-binding universal stress UspA family protein
MIQSILLATDGSSTAGRAADLAASLALRYGATLVILHACDPAAGNHRQHAAAQGQESAQRLVADLALQFHNLGIALVDTEVVEGPAISVILGMADTRHPDMIVVGARGLGNWPGPVLGSVSMAVTQRAECPVLVVK